MSAEDETLRILNGIIDREIERHPHNRALIEAFRPVLVERKRLLGRMKAGEGETFAWDETRFRGGVPLGAQWPLFREDDPWEEISLAMIAALAEGFPDLAADLGRLKNALREKKLDVYDYFKIGREEGKALVAAWCASHAISAGALGLLLSQVSRVVLEKRAAGLAERLAKVAWEKGYCPCCGAFPSLSVIKEKLGERLLHCSGCGHDWRFSRVTCPACGLEGQKGMNFFYIEGQVQESAFTCDQCRRYLITLSRMSDLNDRDLDVSALGLVHLDWILQEKQFAPMTVTDWNVF